MANTTTTTTGPKRSAKKCAALIIAGIIIQTLIIVLFVVLIMKVRNIHVRVKSASVETLNLNSSNSSPSFTMKLKTELAVKNKNFGSYKFGDATVTLFYRGVSVGEAVLVKGKARWRSTKKVEVSFAVKSPSSGQLKAAMKKDLDGGVVALTGKAKLAGKVTVLGMFKKKKAAEMDCSMDVDTVKKQVKNVACK